jgi:hypothetical protein
MQISKLMPLVCSTALCVSVTGIVQAEDNAAQAAARAALLEKMSDVNIPSSSTKAGVIIPDNTPAPAPVQPAALVPPVAPSPATASTPAIPAQQAVIPPDNDAQSKARAALVEKISDVNPSSNVTKVIPPDNTPATVPVQPAAVVPPVAPVQPAAPAEPIVALPAMAPVPVTPVKQVVIPPDNDAQYRARTALLGKLTEPEPQPQPAIQKDNDSQAKARMALLDKLTEPEPQSSFLKDSDVQAKARAALVEKLNQPEPVVVPPAPAPAPALVAAAPVTPTPAPVAVATPAPVAAPVVTTPAQSVALTKEMRLKELLVKYQADEITPAEYHAKRAAIVNGE